MEYSNEKKCTSSWSFSSTWKSCKLHVKSRILTTSVDVLGHSYSGVKGDIGYTKYDVVSFGNCSLFLIVSLNTATLSLPKFPLPSRQFITADAHSGQIKEKLFSYQ